MTTWQLWTFAAAWLLVLVSMLVGLGVLEHRRMGGAMMSDRARILTALLTFRARALSTYPTDVLLSADAWTVLRPHLDEDEGDALFLAWKARHREDFERLMVDVTKRFLAMDDERRTR